MGKQISPPNKAMLLVSSDMTIPVNPNSKSIGKNLICIVPVLSSICDFILQQYYESLIPNTIVCY